MCPQSWIFKKISCPFRLQATYKPQQAAPTTQQGTTTSANRADVRSNSALRMDFTSGAPLLKTQFVSTTPRFVLNHKIANARPQTPRRVAGVLSPSTVGGGATRNAAVSKSPRVVGRRLVTGEPSSPRARSLKKAGGSKVSSSHQAVNAQPAADGFRIFGGLALPPFMPGGSFLPGAPSRGSVKIPSSRESSGGPRGVTPLRVGLGGAVSSDRPRDKSVERK